MSAAALPASPVSGTSIPDGAFERTPPRVATPGSQRWSSVPRSAVALRSCEHSSQARVRLIKRLQALVRGFIVRRYLLAGSPGQWAWLRASLGARLQPHQVTGVRWLYAALARGGGILGDEPGLGKTVQAIAVAESMIASRQATRVLIVAPANLVKNWASEVRRWLGKTGGSALALSVVGADEGGLAAMEKLRALLTVAAPPADASPSSTQMRCRDRVRMLEKLQSLYRYAVI